MVDNVSNIGNAGGAGSARQIKKAYNLPDAPRGTDEVQISSDVKNLHNVEGIRLDKVMEVRRAIQNGTYLTPDKLDKALDKAIDDAVRPE